MPWGFRNLFPRLDSNSRGALRVPSAEELTVRLPPAPMPPDPRFIPDDSRRRRESPLQKGEVASLRLECSRGLAPAEQDQLLESAAAELSKRNIDVVFGTFRGQPALRYSSGVEGAHDHEAKVARNVSKRFKLDTVYCPAELSGEVGGRCSSTAVLLGHESVFENSRRTRQHELRHAVSHEATRTRRGTWLLSAKCLHLEPHGGPYAFGFHFSEFDAYTSDLLRLILKYRSLNGWGPKPDLETLLPLHSKVMEKETAWEALLGQVRSNSEHPTKDMTQSIRRLMSEKVEAASELESRGPKGVLETYREVLETYGELLNRGHHHTLGLLRTMAEALPLVLVIIEDTAIAKDPFVGDMEVPLKAPEGDVREEVRLRIEQLNALTAHQIDHKKLVDELSSGSLDEEASLELVKAIQALRKQLLSDCAEAVNEG